MTAQARRRPTPRTLGLVVAGGCVGALARDGVAQALPTPAHGWPTATLATNLAGAFLLGVLLEVLARGGHDVGWRRTTRLLLGTGLLGAFTTYSTLAVEADLLVRAGRGALAAGYALASVAGGVLAAGLGVAVAAVHDLVRAERHRPVDPDLDPWDDSPAQPGQDRS